MPSHHLLSALAVVFIITWLELVSASSTRARPIKRLTHPSTLALEILPRHYLSTPASYERRSSFPVHSTILRHTDSFRLTISAFNDDFHLHLRPNDHLIHPSARINYYHTGPNGQNILSHTEPLLRESVKAYWGEVIPFHHSASRMREDTAGVSPRPSGKSELGWARIMVHHQGDVVQGIPPIFEGAFSVNGVIHHIMTKENYLRHKLTLDPELFSPLNDPDSHLVIWRDSDIMSPHEEQLAYISGIIDGSLPSNYRPTGPQTCGHDNLPFNTDPLENPALRIATPKPWYDPFGVLDISFRNESFFKRDDVAGGGTGSNFASSIGQNAGCPQSQKVIYMGVAADCEYTQQYGSTQNATTQILTNWNTASALYKTTFNVSLGIVELQVQNTSCPSAADPAFPWNVDCNSNVTLNERLSLFSGWRGQKGDDGAGLWHLMSGCPTGTEVGIAWLATLCQQTSSGSAPSIVSGTAVSTAGRTEWQVVAHEIGHNFGAIHDCTDGCNSTTPCCPLNSNTCNANSQFLMDPVSNAGEMQFSQCSLGNICSLMQNNAQGKTNTSCLLDPDPNRQTISLHMCGNGIVEAGEDCDPGIGVNSTCCDTATCKFTAGSVCDPSSSQCCTSQCSFASSTQMCRPSKDSQCDTAEMCTGNSSTCPPDITARNGKSCGSNGMACASGQCTSLSTQCQTIGASMNLQNACPNQNNPNCQVSCQDPTQSNQCVVLQSQLIDGSPCGYGGMCSKGSCQPGSFLDMAKAWYTQNLQISIPVTVVVGIVLLLLLYGIYRGLRRCCGGARARSTEPALEKVRPRRLSSWSSAPVVVNEPPLLRRKPNLNLPPQSTPPPPLVLQPGTREARRHAPSFAHSNNSAVASQTVRRGNSGSRGPRQQFPTNPINSRSHWVDATTWNGVPQ
jgi:hypothetical protein